jgi:WD40 repeat protein
MARKVSTNSVDASGEENYGTRGVHLDWGSSGSRYTAGSLSTSLDGEYGVGSVTCLAATRGAGHPGSSGRPTKDVGGPLDEEDLLSAMERNRVVAGTTCGDLRVWSVKDVFAAVFYTNGGDVPNQHEGRIFHRGGEGASAGFIGGRRKPATDFAAGSSLTRLKFSLRGRALSGHRGGVSCIDVPSNVYRPDSVVSGGADGLIKLWSLRAPGAIAGRRNEMDKGTSQMLTPKTGDSSPRSKAARNGDALSILSGHGGRVLCVKTAWHGDRLLSGGADRTVRVWDLANSGGKCLHTLSGHFGWVTAVHYWGPNTIISASTDRSIALWDARVRSSPLFTLRHHHAPVSDLLVGSRTDPVMVSSASDGSIAAWDFRLLPGAEDSEAPVVSAAAPTEATVNSVTPKKVRQCKVVRYPAAKLYMHDFCKRRQVYGPVSLARGPSRQSKTVMVVGGDAVTREWDFNTGKIVAEHTTGHCDTVSCFRALQGDKFLDTQLESTSDGADHKMSGTITTSWDGTVRMRTLARKY